MIRAAQIYHFKIQSNIDISSHLPLFYVLSFDSGNEWQFRQQWTTTKFAAQQDEALAATTLIQCGYAPNFKNIARMEGESIHSISIDDEKITLKILNNHSLQDRLNAACEAVIALCKTPERLEKITLQDIFSIATNEFYSYNHTFVSLLNDTQLYFQGILENFIRKLLNRQHIDMPTIKEIELLPPSIDIIRFSDFKYGTTQPKVNRNRQNNLSAQHDSLFAKLSHLDPSIPYTTAQLGISQNTRTTALKNGFLTLSHKEGRTPYYFIHLTTT